MSIQSENIQQIILSILEEDHDTDFRETLDKITNILNRSNKSNLTRKIKCYSEIFSDACNRIKKAINESDTQKIQLQKPLHSHLLYYSHFCM